MHLAPFQKIKFKRVGGPTTEDIIQAAANDAAKLVRLWFLRLIGCVVIVILEANIKALLKCKARHNRPLLWEQVWETKVNLEFSLLHPWDASQLHRNP